MDFFFFRETESNEKTPPDFESQSPFSAFLGIINIFDKSFLLMVKDVHRVGKLEEANVYQISTVSFIPFEVNFFFPKRHFLKIANNRGKMKSIRTPKSRISWVTKIF